jgi:hypothetical protein
LASTTENSSFDDDGLIAGLREAAKRNPVARAMLFMAVRQ